MQRLTTVRTTDELTLQRALWPGWHAAAAVLEKGGHFSGINRKVQIKPTAWATKQEAEPIASPDRQLSPPAAASTRASSGSDLARVAAAAAAPPASTPGPLLRHAVTSNAIMISTPQAAPPAAALDEAAAPRDGDEVVTEALLVLKWGGELTEDGRAQAEQLGHQFRAAFYPG